MIYRATWVLVVASTLASGERTADAQDQSVIPKALDAWQQRLARVKAVRYTLTGTSEQTREYLTLIAQVHQEKPPATVRPVPFHATVLLDVQRHRYRIEYRTETYSFPMNGYMPVQATKTWDGKAVFNLIPPQTRKDGANTGEMAISTGNVSEVRIEPVYEPVFSAHGYVPTVNSPIRPSRLPPKHDPGSFRHRGDAALNGRRCVILRTEPLDTHPALSDEIWADPDREYAIARQTEFSGKNPYCRVDTEFERHPLGWLPKKWTVTAAPGGKVSVIDRITVAAVEVDPVVADEDFTLAPKPGMIVNDVEYPAAGSGLDPTKPAKETRRINADGSSVVTSSTGFTTFDGKQLPPDRGGRWWVWAMPTAAGVVALVIGYLLHRRRRARMGSA